MKATAQDIMTADPITVTPSTSLTQFARICAEDNVSGCPVVTVDGRLEGVVSKTNLLHRLLEGRHDYSASPDFRRLYGLGEDNVLSREGFQSESEEEIYGRVEDIMETEPVTVLPETPILEVTRLLAEHRIHRVMVVDKGRVVGIITSLDVIAHLASGGQ